MKIDAATASAIRQDLTEYKPRKAVILDRKQALNLQLNQLMDALLLVFSLWSANLLRRYLGQIPGIAEVESFNGSLWLIVLIMPLGPLLLELQGFYNFPLQKTVLKSFGQIARALVRLGLLIA